MPMRTLGRTGVQVSLIGLGGWHLGFKYIDDQLTMRIIRTAIDNGINFMDNCWDYNEGASEIRMGNALQDGYRERVFLMTKIDGRTRKEATKQLDESLKRLQVDYIDLVQHHEILRYEDPYRIFDDEGANAALIEARDAGKIRFIGFTGHKDPRIHLHMLEVAEENGFEFDAVQMPLNVMDAHYRSFEKLVLPELVKQKYRRAGNEGYGKRNDPRIQYCISDRVSTVRDEPTDFRGDHGLRKHGRSGTSL